VGSAQKQAVAAAHLVRVERIERLQKALPSGNVAMLLRADGSEASVEGCMVRAATAPPAVSPAQASHLTTQGWEWFAPYCTRERGYSDAVHVGSGALQEVLGRNCL
jgi:hypothetical protein